MNSSNPIFLQINTVVLHRIIEGQVAQFEDVMYDAFKSIFDIHNIKLMNIDSALMHKRKDNIVCLTFDDGFSSDWEIVFSMLIKHGASATFFVVTDWLGKPGYLTKDQVREMYINGMQIGSHSHTHQDFRKLDTKAVAYELIYSKQILEDVIENEISTFSFPFGYTSPNLVKMVLQAGYKYCCTSQHGILKKTDIVIPRNSINSTMSEDDIRKIIEAGFLTRFNWVIEDSVKSYIKKYFGNYYLIIREMIIGKGNG